MKCPNCDECELIAVMLVDWDDMKKIYGKKYYCKSCDMIHDPSQF